MKNLIYKTGLALGSKTFWTIVVIVLVNGVPALKAYIPTDLVPVVDSILGALAVYFHVNPSQDYTSY